MSLVEILYYFSLRWMVAKPDNVQPIGSVQQEIVHESEVTVSLVVEDFTNHNYININNLKQKHIH